jgi:MATE family multidrug resistance protein
MTGYLQIRLWSATPAIGIEALGAWFGGLGNTRIHLVANTTAMLLNVPLNWLLIRGGLGIPALGVDGAALASVLATSAGFAVMVVAFWRWPREGAMGKLSLRELGRVLRFGLPNGLNWFLEFAAFGAFLNAVVPALGTEAVAAMAVVLNVNSVSFMPSFGLSSAGAILVGQAIGEGRRERVPGILLRTFAVAASWQVLVGAVYLAWPRGIFEAFADSTRAEGAQLLAVGATMLALSSAWQLFDAAAITVSEALRAAGDTAFSMWARLLVAWFFFAPLAWVWIVELGGQHEAAIWSIVAYIAVLAVVLALRFRSGAWKRIDLVEPRVD